MSGNIATCSVTYPTRLGNRGKSQDEIPIFQSSGSQFTRQYGITDYEGRHRRHAETQGKVVVSKFDFDPYWWLDRGLDEDDYSCESRSPKKS